ncbi:MAG: hypothetical protein IPM51_05710 [Sphingobacteriaceae bacterium]|nr:hypothetical protein [Sphingobacteriaceae bacterium]
MSNILNKLNTHKICLSYLGLFEDDITDKIIGISEYYLDNKTDLSKLKNKVSFLIAECFQNIVRHGETKKETVKIEGYFQLSVLDDRAILTSCNLVTHDVAKSIESKLNQVNQLDAEGLKKLYTDVLQNGGLSEKGGAGLGLIEMARKSGLPLKFLFREIENNQYRFFLALEIISKKDITEEKADILEIENLYNELSAQKIMMLYKGDLSKDIVVPLVEMVQSNFSNKEDITSTEKRSIITLIESLQNVSKHGKIVNGSKEGLLTMIKSDNNYTIEVSNTIDYEKYPKFESMLRSIKEMDKNELNNLYKKQLMDPEISEEGNCGLGLLEISKNSGGNFNYTFTQQDNKDYYYSIQINI